MLSFTKTRTGLSGKMALWVMANPELSLWNHQGGRRELPQVVHRPPHAQDGMCILTLIHRKNKFNLKKKKKANALVA